MGVKVKHWKGAYWVFINHHRRRKAKRVGEGEKAKRAADRAADIIRGQLAAGNASAFEEARDRPATLAEFAETWLTATVALQCKPATQENYRVAMRRHWLPALGALSLPAITRERIKAVESRPIDPFTPAELTTLLTTAEQHMPEHYPLILTLARTGI